MPIAVVDACGSLVGGTFRDVVMLIVRGHHTCAMAGSYRSASNHVSIYIFNDTSRDFHKVVSTGLCWFAHGSWIVLVCTKIFRHTSTR